MDAPVPVVKKAATWIYVESGFAAEALILTFVSSLAFEGRVVTPEAVVAVTGMLAARTEDVAMDLWAAAVVGAVVGRDRAKADYMAAQIDAAVVVTAVAIGVVDFEGHQVPPLVTLLPFSAHVENQILTVVLSEKHLLSVRRACVCTEWRDLSSSWLRLHQ